jgi:2-polyprenyl-3-methyl-5-hydroxy-6-metoxy-1,4-benzoquinol methylase
VCSSVVNTDRTDELVERLFMATVGALELYSVFLGSELGLYRTLAEQGPLTPRGLSAAAGIDERYSLEWLEQQAVAGFIQVEDASAPQAERRYSLSADQARVLVNAEDEAHVAPFAHAVAGVGQVIHDVAQAYRTGGGVPYSEYGKAFRHGQGHINRPAFTSDLPTSWIGALPDIRAKLESGDARVADIGTGQGWSAIALAKSFPGVQVDGFDIDAASVEDAERFAAEAGVGEGTRFIQADAAEIEDEGPYDLVVILEALHDFARPVESLAAIRDTLAPGGAVLVVDERVADRFEAPGDEVERIMYGWSVVHCLPTQMVESPTAATGTVMRADKLREYAHGAGYGSVEVLDVENDFFRLYRLNA